MRRVHDSNKAKAAGVEQFASEHGVDLRTLELDVLLTGDYTGVGDIPLTLWTS